MSYTMRTMSPEERKYTYGQSQDLRWRTGSIGRLRGDFGSDGNEFWTTWEDHHRDFVTPEFKNELDEVINSLRKDILKDRKTMQGFLDADPVAAFKGSYTTEYGYRMDTADHTFLLRCNPQPGDYNFYCYCYVSPWLNHHLAAASEDIKFIDTDYNILFRLPDGESIVLSSPDGSKEERVCRYIDESHVDVNGTPFHICQFAELMEKLGQTYAPKYPPLPQKCLSTLPSTGELIEIRRYESGYIQKQYQESSPEKNREYADAFNARTGITKAQEAAMVAGSMFGWGVPAANPAHYDAEGHPILENSQTSEEESEAEGPSQTLG